MTGLRPFLPAIGLGITQIMGYGTLMYAYAVLLPHMAGDLGLTLSEVFAILSLGLFFGGLVAPLAGTLVDRYGGRWVMLGGGLAAGLTLVLLGQVAGRTGLFFAILLAEAAAMFVLYNVAFAAVTRLDTGLPPQRSISIITLFGGVASTIFWPLTLWLFNSLGWQATWGVLGLAYLVVCLPIFFWVLSGPPADAGSSARRDKRNWPELSGAARRRGLRWMVISFIFSGYLMGAMMTLWVTNVESLGHSAAMAALAGAVIGPFKTVGRFFEMLLSRDLYPLVTHALSMALMAGGFVAILALGFSVPGIILGAAIYGRGNGINTIARGTLPLALFGHKGYGARLGWISFLQMAINASAPFTFAWLTQEFGGWWRFFAMSLCVVVAFIAYLFIPDPRKEIG
ncbi:MAG TPA: MFS transporter [Aliiroseovarius sp.]|nr:MFS transporter [Aliiroseovarius sp.]